MQVLQSRLKINFKKQIQMTLLAKILPYISLIHSSAGRLRLKLSKEVKNALSAEEINKLANLKIQGVNEFKLNKITGTITILYDNNVLPESLWLALLNGDESVIKNIKGLDV